MNCLYEYEPIPKKYTSLTTYIKEAIRDNKEPNLQKYFSRDFDGIKPCQYCGVFQANDKTYYILPKISKKEDEEEAAKINLNIFTYMLIYAHDLKIKHEHITTGTNQSNHHLFEVFIKYFADGLLEQLQKGVYKNYITQQEALTTLKGKYLIVQNHIRCTRDKIDCEYDEFTMDNPLNQFFLFALKQLMPYATDKNKLKACELILDEVTYRRHIDIHMSNTFFYSDRLTARFKPSFDIAMLLLKKCVPLWQADSKKSFAFLFNMNILFETFIGKIIESIDSSADLPKKDKFFGDLALRPDIIIDDKNLIIDTKYKKLENSNGIDQHDKYQMFAYGKNFDSDTMLLYPQYVSDLQPFELSLGEEEVKVTTWVEFIDLNGDSDYNTYIENITKRVKIIIEPKDKEIIDAR